MIYELITEFNLVYDSLKYFESFKRLKILLKNPQKTLHTSSHHLSGKKIPTHLCMPWWEKRRKFQNKRSVKGSPRHHFSLQRACDIRNYCLIHNYRVNKIIWKYLRNSIFKRIFLDAFYGFIKALVTKNLLHLVQTGSKYVFWIKFRLLLVSIH